MSRFPRGITEGQLGVELANITMGAPMEERREYITRMMLEYRLEKIMRIRVEQFDEGDWQIEDIRAKSYNNIILAEDTTKIVDQLPKDMLRQVELLSHLDNGTELTGVGYRVTENIFYLD